MPLIRKILFPVDFSPACTAAARFVRTIAEIFAADLALLHVVRPFDFSVFELVGRPLPEVEQEQIGIARQRLDTYLAAEFPAAQATRLVDFGDPAARICAVARERQFDLIAMPTHSDSLFRRTLVGSTAAKVLDEADCPVLTPQHSETLVPQPFGNRVVACAVRLDESGANVLRYAGALAQAAGASLSVIHILPERDAGMTDLFDEKETRAAAAARQRIEAMQQAAGTHADVHLAVGSVRETIIGSTEHLRAGLLIVGRGPAAGPVEKLRDLTYALVRDSRCPVLSV